MMKRHIPSFALALAGLLFLVTHFVWLADLPQKLATHFDAAGRPNGWMTRRNHGLFMLLYGLGVPAFIVGLTWLMRLLSPSLLNVPKPEYWRAPENYPRACAIMQVWAQWFAFGLLLWMTLLNRQIVLANLVRPPRLAMAETWLMSAGFVIMTGVSILCLVLRFRKTDAALVASSVPPPTAVGS